MFDCSRRRCAVSCLNIVRYDEGEKYSIRIGYKHDLRITRAASMAAASRQTQQRMDRSRHCATRCFVVPSSSRRRVLLLQMFVEERVRNVARFFRKVVSGIRIVCLQPILVSEQFVDKLSRCDRVAHARDFEVAIARR